MRAQGHGHIIALSSIAAERASLDGLVYRASGEYGRIRRVP